MEEFTKEMEKVLSEKKKKYNDAWKDCSINLLIYKLSKQLDELYSVDSADKSRSKRVAIHVANYAFLLYQRLNKDEGN